MVVYLKRILGLSSVFVFLLAGNLHAEWLSLFRTLPYLQITGQDSMTVCFFTANPAVAWVEWKEDKPDAEAKTSYQVLYGLRQTGTSFKIPLDNLKPGQSYRYRVYAKEIKDSGTYRIAFGDTQQSDEYTFTAIDPQAAKETNVVIFNDLHDNFSTFEKLWQQVDNRNPDFILMNGDIINDPSSEDQIIRALELYAKTFAHRIPMLYVRGNHETRGTAARQFPSYLALPDDRFYFAFTANRVRFIALDGGEDKPDDNQEYSGLVDFDTYRAAQESWFKEEMKTDAFVTASLRVAFCHIPFFPNDGWHGNYDLRTRFNPLFNAGKVDILFSGHTHEYGIYPAQNQGKHDYPIVVGGGPRTEIATVTFLKIKDGNMEVRQLNTEGKTVGTLNVKSK